MSNTYLTDRQIMILLWIRDGVTIPKMAEQAGVSLGTIQKDMKDLMELELYENIQNEAGNTLIAGRKLTEKGKNELRLRHHPVS